jgi:peptidoglycan-N-acetylglucosamine deacetylase
MSKNLLIIYLLGSSLCLAAGGKATLASSSKIPQAQVSSSQPKVSWRSAPGLPPVAPQLIPHGSRARRAIALTFDACQAAKPAGYDRKIIRLLEQTHTPATFFLGGKWMESHPEATRELVRNPLFELGNHSYSHPHLPRLSESDIRREIRRPQDIMFTLTGKQGVLFRAPYGEYDNRVLRIAGQAGLTEIQWEVVSGDPDRKVTASRMIKAIMATVRNGSIIIMHVNGRGWHTAEALPAIITRLKQKGFALVKVSDLLKPSRPSHP